MKYTILIILLPITFTITNIFIIISLDKKLIYENVEIKYREINPISKKTGIKKHISSGGTCISFETINNLKFERRYLGFVQQLICSNYYSKIIQKEKAIIGLWVNPGNKSKRKVPFIGLGEISTKGFWYYADIYSYVKKTYSIFFLMIYMIMYFLLFRLCLKLKTIGSQKHLWIIAMAFPILYMLI
ncbi:hypothetical protein [Bacteroides sp. 224]|uniref:hypothetical protein n=1 Tax=Bacteroides sp. 224 TaxID=2302936 RepID=UPI0013D2DFAC|nr:hypothetical protein [Bacteroides sp. 224]NDV66875.1 hypothetical protein [Bacteroides sp. 224]